MTDVPEEVRRLADERREARAAKDFVRADALRDAIAERGFRVVDSPEGPTMEPIEPAAPPRLRARDVGSVLDEPPTVDASVHWVVEGWPEDVVRALQGFRAHHGSRDVQYVVADLTETDPAVYGEGVDVLALEPDAGWGAARNAGLKRSRGGIVLVMDGSVEPTGDVLGPLEDALADEGVGVCGPFGITTTDLREFHESSGPEVDAVEGYLMALRRDVIRDVGLFDEKFRWYRTADIECSFRIKDAGYRAVVVDVPVRRYEHRMYHATAPEERERLSKRNFYRFLERFRSRFDLLVSQGERPRG
ncbi:MAG TPA: glycosyltransferase [Actinomycetota bacterium]|jgi:cysteinyl-tRNA synthetase|nr:glycosyltransferase [Actinomycetota bacterium]